MKLADRKPNDVIMVIVLQACVHLGDLHQGRCIHKYIIQNGFESDASVGISLLAMYAKCGNVKIARHLFDKMSERDVSSWNAMIARYSQNRQASDTLKLFNEMQLADIKPNLVTVMSVLPAFAHLAAVQQAKGIHAYIIRTGFELGVFVGTSLVDKYVKCGSSEVAGLLFDKISERNLVTWNAMILAYRRQGHGKDALSLFNKMQQTDTKPNDITFICVLSAQALIKKMPVEPDATVLGALMGIFRINWWWNNVEKDRSHPQSEKIHATLETLSGQIEGAGFVPNKGRGDFVLHDVEDEVKDHLLCIHSQKLAIAFELFNTSPGNTIRITKIVSREIIVRDANWFHCFKDGSCSCGDY
eukprot:Gb_28392 [translate_table: standard]